jgi:hypothetical protein
MIGYMTTFEHDYSNTLAPEHRLHYPEGPQSVDELHSEDKLQLGQENMLEVAHTAPAVLAAWLWHRCAT